MLSDCARSIDIELNNQLNIINRLRKREAELENVSNSSIVAHYQLGKIRYFQMKSIDGVRKRVYMNKEQLELRREIQERYYLERAIPLCKKNIEMLEMIHDSFYSLDPVEVVKDAPLAYREQDNACKLLYGVENESRWKERKLKYKARYRVPYPEGLQDLAEDGTVTRSKSEALIINLLNQKGIPYVYECPLQLGNKRIWPDFVIWDRKHNRELLIEHMGRMDDYNYRADQTDKLGLYIQEGYVPNVNLLLTFDDKNGKINVPAISKMIDAILNRH